jgi:hypothetical protein
MRVWSLTLGVICLITGGIWIFQGVGVIHGSFMTGEQLWLIIGILVALVGLGLGFNGLRRPARR